MLKMIHDRVDQGHNVIGYLLPDFGRKFQHLISRLYKNVG